MTPNIPRPAGGERVWIINPSNDPVPVAIQEDSTGQTLIFDESGSLVTMSYLLYEVHRGNVFRTIWRQTVNINIVIDLVFVTPNIANAHFGFEGIIGSSAGASISFMESIAEAGDGALLPVFNADRTSENSNTVKAYVGATITNVGTEIDGASIGAGNTTGGQARGEVVWLLKPNTKYLLRITSGGNNNQITARLNWTEYVHP